MQLKKERPIEREIPYEAVSRDTCAGITIMVMRD